MWTLISLPLQMAERLRRVQPVAVANHVKARHSPIERAVRDCNPGIPGSRDPGPFFNPEIPGL